MRQRVAELHDLIEFDLGIIEQTAVELQARKDELYSQENAEAIMGTAAFFIGIGATIRSVRAARSVMQDPRIQAGYMKEPSDTRAIEAIGYVLGALSGYSDWKRMLS